MKPRTLLVLLALTVILGGFIFLFEKDLPSTDELRQQEKKLLRLAVADIEGLTIEGRESSLRFERREDIEADGEVADIDDPTRSVIWYLVEPLEARADGIKVADLLKDLVALESGQRLDSVDNAQSGLDDPEVKVTLQAAEGDHTLFFGDEIPASNDRIVAIEGESGGHVAPASVVFELRRSASEWRDKSLMTGLRSEVEKVVVTSAGNRLAFEDRAGEFWLSEPLSDRADKDRIGSLLGAVLGLRAESFVEASLLTDTGLGLEPPKTHIEVTFAGRDDVVDILLGDSLVGEFGEADSGEVLNARVDGELVTLKPGVLSELATLEANAWQEAAWSRLEVFQVERAEITSIPGHEMVLARDGSDWKRDGEIIEYSVVSDLLYAIIESEAVEVITRESAASRGFGLQDSVLTMRLATLEDDDELSLFDEVDGLHAATVADRQVVLLLADAAVAEMHRLIKAVVAATAPETATPETESTSSDS